MSRDYFWDCYTVRDVEKQRLDFVAYSKSGHSPDLQYEVSAATGDVDHESS